VDNGIHVSKPKLLIYIPCHKDFEMAFRNADQLTKQLENFTHSNLDIQIVISINGVKDFKNSRVFPKTKILHIEEVLGADANIAKGFVLALETNPDYLWILSANEDLVPDAIQNIQKMILHNPDSDLFVANAAGRSGRLRLQNVFCDLPPQLALGLISGVIYNFNSTKGSFLQSTLFSWTGWGHLAVIQDFLTTHSESKVTEFPDSNIYEKPYTYSPDATLETGERVIVGNLYSHSFFGLPVLAYCLLQQNPRKLKQFQIEWFSHNWFKIRLFSTSATFGDELSLRRSSWIKSIADTSFKCFALVYVRYFVARHIPIERFQNSKSAVKFLDLYKSRL
jgi:hypothetical protein